MSPLRPRFLIEEIVFAAEDRLVSAGVVRDWLYPDHVTRELVEAVSARCDGQRSARQIADELPGAERQNVNAVLSYLHRMHLLEAQTLEPPNEASSQAPAETKAFLRRFAVQRRAESTLEGLLARLSRTRVVVMGHSSTAIEQRAMIDAVSATGFKSVTLEPYSSVSIPQMMTGAEDVAVVLVMRAGEQPHYHPVPDYVRVMPVMLHASTAVTDVGPLVSSSEFCMECWCSSVETPADDLQLNGERSSSAWRAIAGIVAIDLLWSVLGLSERASLGRGRRIDERSGRSEDLLSLITERCGSCRTAPQDPSDLPAPVAALEASIRRVARLALGHVASERYIRIVRGDPYSAKSLSESVSVRMQHSNGVDGGQHSLAGKIDINLLSRLLRGSLEQENTEPPQQLPATRRRHATAGNLGSVELFIVARQIDGLEPGYYLWQGHTSTLARLEKRSGASPVEAAMRRILCQQSGTLPLCLIIWYGAVWRLRRKYSTLAYRLLQFDAGVAQLQLALVARALGLRTRARCSWPDDLIERELNFRVMDEQVTGVTAVWPATDQSGAEMLAQSCDYFQLPSSGVTSRQASVIFREDNLLAGIYDACRRSESSLQSNTNGQLEAFVPAASSAQHATLAEWDHLIPVLKRRRSHRRFASKAVTREDLMTILGSGSDLPSTIFPRLTTNAVRLMLLVRQAGDFAPGAYEYHAASGVLGLRSTPKRDLTADDLYLHREFGSAPAAIWTVAKLALSCQEYGPEGYRACLVRAGAMINRVWLEAVDRGLVACPVAGLVTTQAAKFFQLHCESAVPLLALPLGYPA